MYFTEDHAIFQILLLLLLLLLPSNILQKEIKESVRLSE
jgi:hypothetical protein